MSRLSRMLGAVGVRYERYRIFELRSAPGAATELPAGARVEDLESLEILTRSPSPELRGLSEYGGAEAIAFAIFAGPELAGACCYWFGRRYRTRGFIELPPGAAKLVHITTADPFRGRGLAPALIQVSARAMMARGFAPLLARVWHSHRASIRAFRKAGWVETSMVTTVRVPFRRQPLKYVGSV